MGSSRYNFTNGYPLKSRIRLLRFDKDAPILAPISLRAQSEISKHLKGESNHDCHEEEIPSIIKMQVVETGLMRGY